MSKVKFALCDQCPYAKHIAVKSNLIKDTSLLVVGEAPTQIEVVESELLVDSNLPEMIPEEFSYTTVIACKPDNNEANLETAIRCCAPRLKAVLDGWGKDKVITLGGTATTEVLHALDILPDTDKISQLRGKEFQSGTRKIYPMYATGYIQRNPHEMDGWQNDLLVALGYAQRQDILAIMPTPKIIKAADIGKYWSDLYGRTIAFDLETEYLNYFDVDGKPKAKILCLALATDSDIFVVEWDGTNTELISQLINESCAVAHNGKFDILHLWANGAIFAQQTFDTMLAHHILQESGQHGLKHLAGQYFGIGDYEAEIEPFLNKIPELRNYSKIPKDILYKYAAYDVWITLHLNTLFNKRLAKEGLWDLYLMVMQENAVITKMQFNGIQVDAVYLDQVGEGLKQGAEQKKKELAEMAGMPDLNPSSPTQIAHILYDKFGLPPPSSYKYKGKPRSTDAGALDSLHHPFVELLKEYRSMVKLATSYVENIFNRLTEGDRVHCDFWLHGTVTGRLSTREPALQTIPRGKDVYGQMIKASFVAKPDHLLVACDYSQAELRVAADLSGDKFLLDFFNNGGQDLHSQVAERIWGKDFTKAQRSVAKIVNFAWLYGANASVIAVQAKIPLREAEAIVSDYEQLLLTLKQWRDKQFTIAKSQGYISTPSGRRQRFPIIDKTNWRNVWKSCSNTPIQGGAAEATIRALIELGRLGLAKYLVLTVHDSIILEVPKDEAVLIGNKVQETMVKVASEMFPTVKWKADVDIGERWKDKPEVTF